MTSKKQPTYLLWAGLFLLAVGLVLSGTDGHFLGFWDLVRGEWNERGMLVYQLQQKAAPCLWGGGLLVVMYVLYVRLSQHLLWPYHYAVIIICLLAGAVVLSHIRWQGDERHWDYSCLNHQRRLALAIVMYTMDHDGTFPTSLAELQMPSYTFKCHGDGKPGTRYRGYGLNAHIAGQPVSLIAQEPTSALLTADSVTPMSLLSTPADIDKRHSGKYVASFADGHIEVVGKDVALKVK